MAKFINPYNFVPFAGDRPKRAESADDKENEKLTGRIEYTITTLTPLFIPNTSNDRIFNIQSNDQKETAKGEYHKNYDFFSYKNLSGEGCSPANQKKFYEPVIPGSGIRGAIRSIYEALTDSCLPTMQKPSVIARRTPETYKAGVLVWNNDKTALILRGDKKGESNKIPDNDVLYRDRSNKYNKYFMERVRKAGFRDGEQIWFDRRKRDKGKDLADGISKERTDEYSEKGWLILGMSGPQIGNDERKTKHCVHIFSEGNPISRQISESDVKENLMGCIKAYQENDPDAYKEYEKSARDFFAKKSEGLPVYYSRIPEKGGIRGKEHFYWSPACITREVYYHKLDQCVKGYTACEDSTSLCPACSLFGMLNQNMGVSRASKVRFSDAVISHKKEDKKDNSQYYQEIVTLPELAAPKIQATEFYLQRPQGISRLMTWTYDYYIALNDRDVPELHWYTESSINNNCEISEGDTAVLAGRKFYWHSEKGYEKNIEKKQNLFRDELDDKGHVLPKGRTIRNQTVRPVKKDVTFEGYLYFEKITKEELKRLVAIMNMSGTGNDHHYAIKIGTGKPLGMGSVDLKVNRVILRDASEGYIEKTKLNPESRFSEDLFPDLTVLTYLDFDALKKDQITGYLGTEEWPEKGSEGFNWFMKNRRGYKQPSKNSLPGQLDLSSENKSPNKREQIRFVEYLERGVPETVPNEDAQLSSEEAKREKAYAEKQKRLQEGLKKSNKLSGTVTGYNKRMTSICVEPDNQYNLPNIYIKYGNIKVVDIPSAKKAKTIISQMFPLQTRVLLSGRMNETTSRTEWQCVQILEKI